MSQNCTKCGDRAKQLPVSDIPPVKCRDCDAKLEKVIFLGKNQKNYGFQCDLCGSRFELADILPSWEDEGFAYCGVPAPGDH